MHSDGYQPLAPHQHEYINRFRTELTGRLHRRRVRDADDIVQAELERVKRRLDIVPARYPNPELYARVRFTAAVSDHFRREKRQRGQGTRAFINTQGQVENGREVISGDASIPCLGSEVPLWDTLAAPDGDSAADLESRAMAEDLLKRVSRQDAAILYLSLGLEYSDAEIADRLGCARETVNRRKQRAVRRIRGFLGPNNV